MRAVLHTKYGSPDVLKLEDIPKPIPTDDQVLVKVHAAALNAVDWHILRAKPFPIRFMVGLVKPKHKILGADIAGHVLAVGRNVKQFRAGDDVFGELSACGWGAFAEYVCVPEHVITSKPAGISFEEAAATPLAAVTALQGLRDKGNIRSGQRVLIHGASGGVGTFAVQIAKALGCEVTGVCSASKVSMVRSIGADHVIDYAQEDFTKNGKQYDLILAVNGYHSIFDYRRALSPKGRYVMAGGSGAQMFQALLGPFISTSAGKKMGSVGMKSNKSDLIHIKDLLQSRKVVPVIDRRYPLSETAEAIRYLEEGHALGKVVILVEDNR
jgi:NADPH:quinone reductase-like Zn-dependent oxidoreductase